MLESTNLFGLMRITPKQINYLLMVLDVVRPEFNLEWSLNLLNAFDISDSRTESAVATEDSLLLISDNGC